MNSENYTAPSNLSDTPVERQSGIQSAVSPANMPLESESIVNHEPISPQVDENVPETRVEQSGQLDTSPAADMPEAGKTCGAFRTKNQAVVACGVGGGLLVGGVTTAAILATQNSGSVVVNRLHTEFLDQMKGKVEWKKEPENVRIGFSQEDGWYIEAVNTDGSALADAERHQLQVNLFEEAERFLKGQPELADDAVIDVPCIMALLFDSTTSFTVGLPLQGHTRLISKAAYTTSIAACNDAEVEQPSWVQDQWSSEPDSIKSRLEVDFTLKGVGENVRLKSGKTLADATYSDFEFQPAMAPDQPWTPWANLPTPSFPSGYTDGLQKLVNAELKKRAIEYLANELCEGVFAETQNATYTCTVDGTESTLFSNTVTAAESAVEDYLLEQAQIRRYAHEMCAGFIEPKADGSGYTCESQTIGASAVDLHQATLKAIAEDSEVELEDVIAYALQTKRRLAVELLESFKIPYRGDYTGPDKMWGSGLWVNEHGKPYYMVTLKEGDDNVWIGHWEAYGAKVLDPQAPPNLYYLGNLRTTRQEIIDEAKTMIPRSRGTWHSELQKLIDYCGGSLSSLEKVQYQLHTHECRGEDNEIRNLDFSTDFGGVFNDYPKCIENVEAKFNVNNYFLQELEDCESWVSYPTWWANAYGVPVP